MGWVFNGIINQKGAPAVYTDVLANRPAAGYRGRLFINNDGSGGIYYDTGITWSLLASPSGGSTPTLQDVTTAGSVTSTNITAAAFIVTGGTANQFLKGDGSLDSSTYITATSTNTLTNKSGNISQWTNDSGYITNAALAGYLTTAAAAATYLTIATAAATYLTGNQTISLSGDISGSGATAITTTIGANKITNTMLAGIASSISSGLLLFGSGGNAFNVNAAVYYDGTYLTANNFLTGGKYFVQGGSGGTDKISYDGAGGFFVVTDFDTLNLQAGVNDANKRQINFYTGLTQAAYIDISANFWSTQTLSTSDNSKKFATTEFVKSQGYITTATTITAGTGISVSGTTNVTVTNTGTLQQTTTNGNTSTNGIALTVSTTSDALTITKTNTGNAITATGIVNLSLTVAMTNASQYNQITNLIYSGANTTNTVQSIYAGTLGQFGYFGTGAATYNAKTIAAGVVGKGYIGTTGGSYNKLSGVGASLEFKDNTNVTFASNFYALAPYVTSGQTYTGTITNFCGVYIDDTKGNTDIPALGITNSWGIYQAGTNDNNYYAGKVLIGSTTNVGASRLQVTGSSLVSSQSFEGTKVLRGCQYISLTESVANTIATITGNNANVGLNRVIIEYAGYKNNAGTLTYESGRLTAFFRIGAGVQGLSITDILGTSFFSFAYSLSGSVLTITTNPGVCSNGAGITMQITVLTDGSNSTLAIS